MTNGHVLVAADGPGTTYSPPTHLYDYDPVANTFTETDPPPFQGDNGAAAFGVRMLALPNGRVAVSFGSNQIYQYPPDSDPNPAWAPTISGITTGLVAGTFTLSGTQLNGITAGASYGDDAEMDSNYPIVEFLDHGGGYHFARTLRAHGASSAAVSPASSSGSSCRSRSPVRGRASASSPSAARR